MRSKFRLELDVVLDTDAAPSVIEAARQYYVAEGAVATVDKNGAAEILSAEDFIDEIEDALMELMERNPLLNNANVEIEHVLAPPGLNAPMQSAPVVRTDWRFCDYRPIFLNTPCDWVTHRRGDQRGRTLIDRGVSWWIVVRKNSRRMDRHVAVHSQGAERRWDLTRVISQL